MAVKTPGRPGSQIEEATPARATPSPLPAPGEKRDYVRAMFDAIAPRYDLLNSVLSARMHHGWRRAAATRAALAPGGVALDVCSGTGDLAFELARRVGVSGAVVGADFSEPMLRLGAVKAARKNLDSSASVRFALADTQRLPFPTNAFDAVTVAFGIRNVADVAAGIVEMARVVRPGGRVVILEFTQPRNPVFAALYRFYSFRLMPLIGGLISGRRAAYAYLPASVAAFQTREGLSALMLAAGLTDVAVTDLTLGVVALHSGTKSGTGA